MGAKEALTEVHVALSEPGYSEFLKGLIKEWKGIKDVHVLHEKINLETKLKEPTPAVFLIDEELKYIRSITEIKRIFENYNHHKLVLFYRGEVNPIPASFYTETGSSAVSRTAAPEAVRNALHFIINNRHYTGGYCSMKINAPANDSLNLTPKQAEVFELLKKRYHYSYICEHLDISHNTYREYRQLINEKLKLAGFTGIKEFLKGENRLG